MTSPSNGRRVVIVGGGLSGLSAAVRLVQAGLPVTLLEMKQIGSAASTVNQGWLYSGAWFAREDPALAAACHHAMRQTLAYCPACVEDLPHGYDHAKQMVYFTTDPDSPIEPWTHGWEMAGIPFHELGESEIRVELPDVDPKKIARAFLLPDRGFRPEILLEQLAATAENHGVEIRAGVRVRQIETSGDAARGVLLDTGETLEASYVIDATGAFHKSPWSESLTPEWDVTGTDREIVLEKLHLVAGQANLQSAPFCVLDADGFNAIHHGPETVFGSGRWKRVPSFVSTQPDAGEFTRLWSQAEALIPGLDRTRIADRREWTGITAQAPHRHQVATAGPRTVIIDHGESSPPVYKMISIYPGRATLWPLLADATRAHVLDALGHEPPHAPGPPWGVEAACPA